MKARPTHLVLTLLIVTSVPALAFESNAPGHRVHEAIATEAALSLGFDDSAADELADAVAVPDASETKLLDLSPGHPWVLSPDLDTYEASHHFDRGPSVDHIRAFQAGAAYVRARRAAALAAIRAGERAAAIRALGEALHALQDFYSHSNFVDLTVTEREACTAALWNPSADVPAALHITAYFPNDRHPEEPDDPLDYTHAEHSKDSANKNIGSSTPPHGGSGPTRFQLARAEALRATTRLLRTLRDSLSQDEWTTIAHSAHD